jgi:hypothetical protein
MHVCVHTLVVTDFGEEEAVERLMPGVLLHPVAVDLLGSFYNAHHP